MTGIKEITAAELRHMRESGVPHQLVDLREPYEAERCSMGGQLIPMGEITGRLDELKRDVTVVMHCQSGNRAAAVVQALCARYGFSNLVNLQGGIVAYAQLVDDTIHCD
jgi:adenylyltransferase/sulfurtransferase